MKAMRLNGIFLFLILIGLGTSCSKSPTPGPSLASSVPSDGEVTDLRKCPSAPAIVVACGAAGASCNAKADVAQMASVLRGIKTPIQLIQHNSKGASAGFT